MRKRAPPLTFNTCFCFTDCLTNLTFLKATAAILWSAASSPHSQTHRTEQRQYNNIHTQVRSTMAMPGCNRLLYHLAKVCCMCCTTQRDAEEWTPSPPFNLPCLLCNCVWMWCTVCEIMCKLPCVVQHFYFFTNSLSVEQISDNAVLVSVTQYQSATGGGTWRTGLAEGTGHILPPSHLQSGPPNGWKKGRAFWSPWRLAIIISNDNQILFWSRILTITY